MCIGMRARRHSRSDRDRLDGNAASTWPAFRDARHDYAHIEGTSAPKSEHGCKLDRLWGVPKTNSAFNLL